MVQIALLVLAFSTAFTHAAPLTKRIAQNIPNSTKKWEAACRKAGGGLQCNPIAVAAFDNLLAAHGPCDQQDAADGMVDFAKKLGNDPDMIRFAQIFAQQPRNTPSSQSVPYCQKAPRNTQLRGLFQCQFAGADKTTFVGGTDVGGPGTVPFGRSVPVNPPGSCLAHPGGPIPDGQQLVDITENPGVGGGGGGGGGAAPPAAPPKAAAKPSAANPAKGGGNFQLQNGHDAQKLNAKFAKLNPGSQCTAGEQACINGGFAQCVGGNFAITQCAAGTICAALPLVNKPGTSLACTTKKDALARIAATGATGGLTGNGSPATPQKDDKALAPKPAPAPDPAPAAGGGNFHLKNGQDAQKLNAKFAGLSASTPCKDGDQACIEGGFAQCTGGKFVTLGCGAGTQCFGLPLVNKPGTSLACTTNQDALDRIAATGAKGGLTG